ncbi:MAG: hypothetical protein ABIZ52_04545 [Candidatus Limnocylindrales bacterium]
MTSEARLERGLSEWFSSDASAHPPIDLHASAMARVRRARQRPAVLVMLRGDRLSGADTSLGRVRTLVFVGAALLLVTLAALLVVGARPPDVAPNGASSWITYVSGDVSSPSTFSIWRVLGDGSGDHQVGRGECPMVSANGTSMVFLSGRSDDQLGRLIAANGDGTDQRILADVDRSTAAQWTAAISPDGSAVAWVNRVPLASAQGNVEISDSELWVSPLAGGPGTLIVPQDAVRNFSYRALAWANAGDRIAIVRSRVLYDGSLGPRSIWVVDADGSDLHQVASVAPASPSAPVAWSPDGRWLAYVRDTDAGFQLMVLAVDGSVETPVASAADDSRPQDPTWSPDGNYLAYRDQGGIATIEMSGGVPVRAPNHGPAQSGGVTYDIGAWSPDSRNLLVVEAKRVGPESEAEGFGSRLLSVDAALQGPTTLVLERAPIVGYFSACPLSWRAP